MKLSKIFNIEEIELIKELENIENRDYTKDDLNKIKNNILDEIMSKSYKNGDMDKCRSQYSTILNKIDICHSNI